MSVIWNKVWFDLWHNKLRTLMVVVSIAVGVFAVGTTFGMVDQMLPAMDAAHASTNPAHATLYTNGPVDLDTIRALKNVPGVVAVEAASEVSMRYKLHPEDPWKKGTIQARADYEHQIYDHVQLKEGSWPEGRALGIERMHSPWYKIYPGDRVIVEVGDQPYIFPITGIIRHPFVPPPSMYDLAFFFSDETVMEMFDIPLNHFTQVRLSVNPYSPDYVRVVASAVKDRLAQQRIGVIATLYQDPAVHWGREFIDGFSYVIRILAVLSMLLSVILVLNTLTAVITQQTNQIGVLKAIGATSFSITRVYLAGVLVYGILSLGVALPLGVITSYSITRSFLALYNIDYEQFALSQRAVTLQAISALIVPLAAALLPVWNGARLTVRQAISSYGIGADFGSNWVDQGVERLGRRFLASYNAMALANTFRRKGRLALTQMVLVIAGVMFLMVMSLSSSLNATLDAEFGRRSYDLMVNFSSVQRVDRTIALARTIPGVEDASMWLASPVTILHAGQKALGAGMGSSIQGVDVADPMYVPQIVAGRWLQPGDRFAVVMERDLAEDEHIAVGDTIVLDMGPWGKHDWQVVGFYQTFLMFGGGYSVDALYAPREAVYEASKKTNKAGSLLVRTYSHDLEAVDIVAARLEDALDARNIEISLSETLAQTRKTADASFGIVVYMLMVLAALVAVVGGIGLTGSLWLSVIERTKEIGILRAIGAVSRSIIGMYMLEGVFQGLLSWAIAAPIAYLVSPAVANTLGLVMFGSQLYGTFSWSGLLLWLLLVVVISIVASIVPARHAAGINIRQSLSYE